MKIGDRVKIIVGENADCIGTITRQWPRLPGDLLLYHWEVRRDGYCPLPYGEHELQVTGCPCSLKNCISHKKGNAS